MHSNEHKSIAVAYVLWFFLGILGVHRFYLGRITSGVVYLLTAGVFGIGWLVDICLIPAMVEEANARHDYHHHHHHHDQGPAVIYVPQPQTTYPSYAAAPYQPQPYAGPPMASAPPTYH